MPQIIVLLENSVYGIVKINEGDRPDEHIDMGLLSIVYYTSVSNQL